MDRSRFYDRDPITLAMLDAESNFNPYAVSPKGARGIAQIMPATARDPGFGVPPIDLDNSTPEEQAAWAEQYRKATSGYLADRLPQNADMLGVAAYNAGPGTVMRAGGDISRLPQETQDYVPKVLGGSNPSQLAALVAPDLPPGKAAETGSKDALQELISIQKQRMQGNDERDSRMRWLSFFQGLGGNHASIGDALVSGIGAAGKTATEQQAQHEKMVDSSLDNQIKLEGMRQEQGLREAQANYYNAGARGARGGNSAGKWVSTKDAAGNPILFNKATSEVKLLGGDTEAPQQKPMPVGALKLQDEVTQSLSVGENLVKDAERQAKLIREGKVPLEPTGKIEAWGRNMLGMSDDQSLAYGEFNTFKEKLRNDTLLLAKGVQTEGDAQRALDALVAAGNDPKLAAQAMDNIAKVNKRSLTLQKKRQSLINKNYGIDEEIAPALEEEQDADDFQSQYDAMPSGTEFTAPDGTQRRKP